MTEREVPCPHCVISELIESNIPEEHYSRQDLVLGMIEITLDMIATADDSQEQQALFTAAVVFLAEGSRDIHAGRYKTKRPNINDVQGNA